MLAGVEWHRYVQGVKGHRYVQDWCGWRASRGSNMSKTCNGLLWEGVKGLRYEQGVKGLKYEQNPKGLAREGVKGLKCEQSHGTGVQRRQRDLIKSVLGTKLHLPETLKLLSK